jgi:hypothetical protein
MTTVPAHQIAADLLSAAAYVEQFGLAKGHYGNAGRPCCAAGALQVAIFGRTLDDGGDVRTDDSDRYKLARQELLNLIPSTPLYVRAVADWNDARDTTEAAVIAKFREAAAAVFPS